MADKLYTEFYDPSEDFLNESRSFCYEISSDLIKLAKQETWRTWYESEHTVKGILLLLFTWNFASPITKKLNLNNIHLLLQKTKDHLLFLEDYNILNADENAWPVVISLFNQFKSLLGQTGASKALSLLNPELFVMWDTQIRNRVNRELIPGIGNGKTGDSYVIFLRGIQRIIDIYNIESKLPPNVILAKKIDEYHYVRIIMNRKVKNSKQKTLTLITPTATILLPDNLRGRSIRVRVIPTVCNLKNMLDKLIIVNGDYSLLKPWEKRSYDAYLIEKIKPKLLISNKELQKQILRNHILQENPIDLGASCIDIYLVAYVAETYGSGKKKFFQYIKDAGISQNDNSAQAIWQVGKGDGVFLELLESSGRIKDIAFFMKWINGPTLSYPQALEV